MFRKSSIGGFASIMLGFLLFSAPASAIPVLWSLQNVTFTDGGMASGTFLFDADTDAYSNINITTTAGSVRPGATYGIPRPLSPGNSKGLVALDAPPAVGVSILFIEWASSLTNAGGTVLAFARPPGTSFELQCSNAACSQLAVPFRDIAPGGFVTTVPEPGTLAILGLGLAALGITWRKRLI